MTEDATGQITRRRLALFLLGWVSGWSLWLLADNWQNPALPPALYLALLSFAASCGAGALALAGPVPPGRALAGGAVMAVLLTGLISLAARRFEPATAVLEQPAAVAAAVLLMLIALPFLSLFLQDRRRWRDHALLFGTAWGLGIRVLAALFCTALFWLLASLSDALLSLVDVTVLGELFEYGWLVSALSGGILGLALAAAHELRAAVSPELLLRFLRLLSLPVLAVVAVFLAAVPLKGLSGLFGDYSAAGVLMGAGLAAILLVAAVLGGSPDTMPQGRVSAAAARLLALLLLPLALLAARAVLLRVGQYGWTPDRVLAATAAAILLAFGSAYCAAVLLPRPGWDRRIRRANVTLALMAALACAASLTPLLDAWRISAKSQAGRYLSGQAAPAELPLWEMAHDWGRAGAGAIAELEAAANAAGHKDLSARLQDLRRHRNRWEFEAAGQAGRTAALRAELAQVLPVRPRGNALAAEDLAPFEALLLENWLAGCGTRLDGGRPGCVLVLADLTDAAREGLLFYRRGRQGRAEVSHLRLGAGGGIAAATVLGPAGDGALPAGTIERLMDEDYDVGPVSLRALRAGGAVILPLR